MSSWPAQQGALCISPKWITNCIYSALRRRLAFLLETVYSKSHFFHMLKAKLMPGCSLMYPTFTHTTCAQAPSETAHLRGHSRTWPWSGAQVRSSLWISVCPDTVEPPAVIAMSQSKAPALDLVLYRTKKLIISAKWQVFIFVLNKSISLQEQKNKFQCHVYFSQT